MDCPPWQKKEAVAERWPLMEARLYNFKMVANSIKLILSIKKKSVQGTIFFFFGRGSGWC